MTIYKRLASLILTLSIMFITACATNPVSGGKDFVMMSEEQELALGRQYHKEVMKKYKELDDPEIKAMVERVGEELGASSHRKNLIYHFTVLDSPEVNAFATPGGYVYITRGIMAYMNSETDLAGVIGHEIGHVTARHSVRQHAQQQLAGLLGAAVAIKTGSRAAADLSNVLGTAIVRGYGRKHELEADRLGAEYIARVGHEPDSMLDVIEILKDQEEFEQVRAKAEGRKARSYHGTFSTHPRNDDRLKEVINAANRFKASGTRPDNHTGFMRAMDGVVYGHGEDQGVIHNGQFYHKGLDFTIKFPQGWRIKNLPDRLIALSPSNDAVIQMTMIDRNKRESAEQFLRGQFKGKGFREGRSLRSQGADAYAGLANLDTQFGRRPTRVSAVFHGKRAFVVVGAHKNGVVGQSYFDSIGSIRRLRNSEKKLAEARTLRVVRARRGDTFAKLASRSSLTNYAEEQLRLLNGMFPDGEPKPGQLIKVVD